MHVLLPKTYIHPNDLVHPLFFFGGPIQGADDWQMTCYKIFSAKCEKFTAIIPYNYPLHHPMRKTALSGKEDFFTRQTIWERFYLSAASQQGCILFWLPEESKTRPRSDGSPYARDSYGEVAEWRGQMIHQKSIRCVVGAEKNFPGLSQISCNFSEALGTGFRIYSTLEETVDAALAQACM